MVVHADPWWNAAATDQATDLSLIHILLFHRSIAENIAYGRPDATIEEIREAARAANALEFIED